MKKSAAMRALVQRVTAASVKVEGEVVGEIGDGLCVFVGVKHGDSAEQAVKLANKLWTLRCIEDEAGAMNKSAEELQWPLLIVSQFTLYGDTRKGRRPSFIEAARPEEAEPLIERLIEELRKSGAHVETGRFRTYMQVSIVNDGPTTLSIEI